MTCVPNVVVGVNVVCVFPNRTRHCTQGCLNNSPDTDYVSHFVHDNSFKNAVRFQIGNVGDVKSHFPRQADGVARDPHVVSTRRSKRSPDTVNYLQRRGNQETASRVCGVPPARNMGNNLGPPAPTTKGSEGLNESAWPVL